MEPREGVEPTAYCLQSSRTTIVLSRQFGIDRGFITKKGYLFRLSRSMPDGTLAHLRLAEREGFDPPCPFGLRFSRPTHLPILPPLHSAGLSLLVTFAKVGTCRSQRSARLNGLPVWTRTRNSRINSAVHYHCATGK